MASQCTHALRNTWGLMTVFPLIDCAGSPTPGSLVTDVTLAVATVVLIFSLVVFGISYVSDREREEWERDLGWINLHLSLTCVCVSFSQVCLRNSLKDRQKAVKKEVLVTLDTPLRPLDEKDLMMIRTLGAKPPTAPLTSTSRWCWTKLVEPLSEARWWIYFCVWLGDSQQHTHPHFTAHICC